MTFPYEILLRGENGIFKGGHLIVDPFDKPTELTVENLQDLIGQEMATILTRNIELEREIEIVKEREENRIKEYLTTDPVKEKAWYNFWS